MAKPTLPQRSNAARSAADRAYRGVVKDQSATPATFIACFEGVMDAALATTDSALSHYPAGEIALAAIRHFFCRGVRWISCVLSRFLNGKKKKKKDSVERFMEIGLSRPFTDSSGCLRGRK